MSAFGTAVRPDVTAILAELSGAVATTRAREDAVVQAIAVIEATEGFRLLRRVPDWPLSPPQAADDAGIGTAVIADVETTGLDVSACEVIELAMSRIEYDRSTGDVIRLTGRFSGLRQPSQPIPEDVRRLTGIGDAEVAGQSIDGGELARFIGPADLVIAHNAAFDRAVLERHWGCFAAKPWGCSYREVDWAGDGYDGARLGHLLMQAGGFHSGHRAPDDVAALVHLLALPLPVSGRTGLSALLERARRPTVRIWAAGAPFASKGTLKERGYRWDDGRGDGLRSWWRDVDEADVVAELAFLQGCVLGSRAPPLRRITAWDRYSARAAKPDPSSLSEQADRTGTLWPIHNHEADGERAAGGRP